MRYLLYARKSSESDDKQAQSIEDQLKDLRALATQRGLQVIGELTEAKSAKAPGGRPVFAELVSRLQAGEADAILCWHVNRLFRNPVDFGTVSWMLQNGDLKEIHTPSQIYRSGDNVLLLSVENGMANQYILDLRKVVQRGLDSKIAKGWYPHKAPTGYRNVNAIIEPDPERFDLIRQAWDLMLTGLYTPPQVLDVMTNQWGYTTRRLKQIGGTPYTKTSIYSLFSNIFYAGYFMRKGEIFLGSHVPMVTLEEFFRVQRHLCRRLQARRRTHHFTYAGLMECGNCGCAIIGDYKTRRLLGGRTKTYTYYTCSNSKGNCNRRGLTEEQVDRQIKHLLDTIRIEEELEQSGLVTIRDWKRQYLADQHEQVVSLDQEIESLEQRRSKLLDLKLNDLLSDAEFVEQKAHFAEQVSTLRLQRQLRQEQESSVWENLENTLSMARYGAAFFEGGEPAMRMLIARTVGTRYILTNKSLSIEINQVFSPLCEMKNASISGSGSQNEGVFSPSSQVWWGTLDRIRKYVRERNPHVPSGRELLEALPSGHRATHQGTREEA